MLPRRTGLRTRLARHTGAVTLALLLTAAAACTPIGGGNPLREKPRTDHDAYAQVLRSTGLDTTAMGREWLAASDSALRAPLALVLPVQEVGAYLRTEARAVAYRIPLRDGERLRVVMRVDGLPARLYLDLFEPTTDSVPRFEHLASARVVRDSVSVAAESAGPRLMLDYEATRTGDYLLRFQPELLRSGRYRLEVSTEPTLAFPVQGRGNAAIQSLFGVDRDGGRRSHHGIDIFAPRGTPVLASTGGTVRSISPNELGGNVVWLSDPVRRQTLYYAHLDRHHVVEGQVVQRGDTLGFVGNTGNARTTAPHLHFGIYRRPDGPIDPLHHVRINLARADAPTADTTSIGRIGEARQPAAPLRVAARDVSAIVRRVDRATRLRVMAVSANRLRVQLDDGTSGYLPPAAVRLLDQ